MYTHAGHYIGWVGHRNLGDEAMWAVCREQFPRALWSVWGHSGRLPEAATSRAPGNRRHLLHIVKDELRTARRVRFLGRQAASKAMRQLGGEAGLLGGGTLINQGDGWLSSYRELRNLLGRPLPVFGTGVSSAEFYRLQPGWTDRLREWADLFAELPVIGVRGPHSKAELEEAGARNVIVSGDPAVLLYSPPPSPAPQPGSKLRIGINAGRTKSAMWGSGRTVEEILAHLAGQLISEGHSVTLLSICPEDDAACREVACQAALPLSSIRRFHSSHRDFLKQARELDLVVAFKLHAAILSAAALTPFIALEYLPKCADFAASIGWSRFVVRTSNVRGLNLLDLVFSMRDSLPALRADLDQAMAAMAAQFRRYCQALDLMFRAEPCSQVTEQLRRGEPAAAARQ